MITCIKKKILLFILLLTPIFVNASVTNLSEEYQTQTYKAEVTDVISEVTYPKSVEQTLKVEVLSGKYAGEKVEIKNTYTDTGYSFYLEDGDNISVIVEDDGDEVNFYFHSIDKSGTLMLLVLVFSICVIILGGMKGFKALVSLIITVALILLILVPLLLKGYNPIILSILVCVFSTILTFVITNGFSKKTLIAILGVSCGLIIAGSFAYLFGVLAKISGFSSGDAQMLQYLPNGIKFDYKGLLFAGIIIGALGACMDVAMEITSSLVEIKKHKPDVSDKELIISGFNIGKDIMGTMVNTLILAYTGGSLSSILIFVGFEKSLYQIVNLESIATEIIRAVSGSIGLLFAIPSTVYIFILLNRKWGKKIEKIK